MTADFSSTIDLTQAEPFRLGSAEIHPALSEVIWEGGKVSLQPRVMQVLVVLGTHPDTVISRDVLIDSCWSGRTVGDDAINRCIGQLRKLAQQTGAFQVETIPRVGYRLTAGRPAVRWRRPAIYAAACVLGLALVGLGTWRLWSPTDERTPRVQVLNFRDAGGGEHTAELASYLVADIAGVLAQSGIKTVASRPSGEADVDRRKADLQIGGVVRADGARLKVRVFLNDPRADIVLWSNEFDRPATEIEQLRAQVSSATAETMHTVMEPLQQKGLKLDPETLAFHLRASEAIKSPEQLRQGESRRAAEQVVARAPNFALGHGILALTLVNEVRASADPSSAVSLALIARAETEARTAIRIDPFAAGAAFDTLHFLQRLRTPRDFIAIEDRILEGLRMAPEFPFLHMRECRLLTEVGRARDAMPYCQRALALRPLAGPINYSYARAIYVSGDQELAHLAINQAARRNPDHSMTRYTRFELAALARSPAEARQLLDDPGTRPQYITTVGDPPLDAYLSARASGSAADARAAVKRLRESATAGTLEPDLLVRAVAALGQTDVAFDLMSLPDSAIEQDGPGFLLEPSMKGVRRDPRFWRFAARGGLTDYWSRRGVWPDFCGAELPLATCKARAGAAPHAVPGAQRRDVRMSGAEIRGR